MAELGSRNHVLVIGIDGVRADELRAAHTPHLDSVAAAGFCSDVWVDERNPTISGPVWATVASGVYSDDHLIVGNEMDGHRLADYPDFLTRVRAHYPTATTFAAAFWEPLISNAGGGPIFATGGYLPAHQPGVFTDHEQELAAMASMDEAVTARTARELLHRDHAALFSYLGVVDEIGHAVGVTDRYRKAIEVCDEQVGVMLAAIAARPRHCDEEWTVIAVTDHGHRDTGDHGGNSPEERTAWIAAMGPGIAADSGVGVDHADIPIHVLSRLGIPIQGSWGLKGVDFGRRGQTGDFGETSSAPSATTK